MSRRSVPRRRTASVGPSRRSAVSSRQVAITGSVVVGLGLLLWQLAPIRPETLRARAEAAESSGDMKTALHYWRAYNQTKDARSRTWLSEARACLALDLAGQAESALVRATEADPGDADAWRLRLDLLRTEGRTVEAVRAGWAAFIEIPPRARPALLRELTLSILLDDMLADFDDARSLSRLERWAAADPSDIDARIARRRRVAAGPRPGPADLAGWVETLTGTLRRNPSQTTAREALVLALIDDGDPEAAQTVLDAWPEAGRDARYHRLKGRLLLDVDDRPDLAVSSLESVLVDFPHDWKTRTVLARAYRSLQRPEDAAREAERVTMLRERLAPATLIPRLSADLARIEEPRSRLDLADLCATLGLHRLADALRR